MCRNIWFPAMCCRLAEEMLSTPVGSREQGAGVKDFLLVYTNSSVCTNPNRRASCRFVIKV